MRIWALSYLLLCLWPIIDKNKNGLLTSNFRGNLRKYVQKVPFFIPKVISSLPCELDNVYVLTKHQYSFPIPPIKHIRSSNKEQCQFSRWEQVFFECATMQRKSYSQCHVLLIELQEGL